jgi:hypothetical protein
MPLLASEFDKSRFFKAEDIKGERKFRIKEVTTEEVGEGRDKETKLVVWFTNEKRGLSLNRTNNRVLRGAFGDDTALWAEKIIIIFTMPTEFRGKMTSGMRVRIPPPKQSPATAGGAPKSAEPPQQPVKSGNGTSAPLPAAAAPPAAAVHDPELEPDPKPSLKEELDDEINF